MSQDEPAGSLPEPVALTAKQLAMSESLQGRNRRWAARGCRLWRFDRRAVELTVAEPLQRTSERRFGFRGGDLGVTSGIARLLSVTAATALRHRKWFPPAGGRCEAVMVVMALRP